LRDYPRQLARRDTPARACRDHGSGEDRLSACTFAK